MIGNQYAYRGDDVTVWAHYKRMQSMLKRIRCQRCGSKKQVVIHHKDHNPRNTVPNNLMCLCRACHASHHAKEKKNAHRPAS